MAVMTDKERWVKDKRVKAAKKVVDKLGGPTIGAKVIMKILHIKIDKVSLSNWTSNGIPPTWAEDVYDLTGIVPWITNPHVFKRIAVRKHYFPAPRKNSQATALIKELLNPK